MYIKKIISIFTASFLALGICYQAIANQQTETEVRTSSNFALLVGVSEYPSLDQQFQLKGPKHDVELMYRVLLERGFNNDNITLLATGVKNAEEPTKQAIMASLSDLAEKAQKDDFIYLHFGGHGSQQLASTTDLSESDGKDEIFLPSDIGEWNDSVGKVDNAITDNEIGEALMAIRQKGAFVWVVFDSCHSGTMTRGAPANEVRYRKLEPWQLTSDKAKQEQIREQLRVQTEQHGVKSRGQRPTQETLTEGQSDDDNALGGYVAFFAAQTTEVTPEMRLPRSSRKRVSHGLFSYTIAEILSSQPEITYRQAGQQILQRYATIAINAPTPLFEGSHLDAPLMESTQGERVSQWLITKQEDELKISAGEIHQIGEGSILAILKSPSDKTEAAIGYLEVVDGDLFSSIVEPFSADDKVPAIAIDKLPEMAYARLIDVQQDMSLKVALPLANKQQSEAEVRAVDLIQKIQTTEVKGVKIQWVAAGDDADLRLAIFKDQIWLLPPGGERIEQGARKSLSIKLKDKLDKKVIDELTASLQSIAKVTNLLRLTSTMEGLVEEGIEIAFSTTPKCRKSDENCSPVEKQIMPGQLAQLLDKDKVNFVVKNTSDLPVDVTLLVLDGRYGISVFYPRNGQINRIEAGGSKLWETKVNAKTIGLEHLLVIAVQAEKGQANADFSFLAQPQLLATRGLAAVKIEDRLREAGFAETRTRGLDPEKSQSKTELRLFSWVVSPRK